MLEPWITPSIFDRLNDGSDPQIVDEYTLGQQLGPQRALDEVFRPHWDSFMGFEDFRQIKNAGFNLVRIPIGYWAYDENPAPFVPGAAPYMDAAIDWARSVGLTVMIDLHGAPRSQNGFDNSGQRRDDGPGWQQGDSVARTLRVLKKIQDKYADPRYDDVIAGIELLNEPFLFSLDVDNYRQFVRDGYGQTRDTSPSRVVVFSDGFLAPTEYNGFLTPDDGAHNVALDHHHYQVFSDAQVAQTPRQHREELCGAFDGFSGSDKWTVIGEWSGAMTDCATYLNGFARGARFDGTLSSDSVFVGDCAPVNNFALWDQRMKDYARAWIEAQIDVFERLDGWMYVSVSASSRVIPD